ncbi:MAG: MarR family transcriptional regulator [Steroidobacteraceae bacterium]
MQTPIETLAWETRRLFRALAQAADDALAPLGITASERALLEFLAREKTPISLSDLARKRAVSRQHIHQTLARLPHADWVDRQNDPGDARSVLLALSPSGRCFWRRVRAADRAFFRQLGRQVGSTDIGKCARTLRRVREALAV